MTGQAKRILVADDEETVRSLLKRTLEGVGYEVVTVANGIDALAAMSQQEIDVALLDIKMPGMTGVEVLGKLTTDWPDTCAVMLTAVTDTQTAINAMKMGAYDYITKPFNLDDVVLRMHRAIEKRDLAVRNRRYQVELQESVKEQAQRLQSQFNDLILTLAREHRLLQELAASRSKGEASPLSKLPAELQKPMSSIEEFRDALLKILRK